MKAFEKIYQAVKKIPPGKVATYGQMAKMTGTNPKVVGYALHGNKSANVPCHRVVNRFGGLAKSFAFGGEWEQKKRLDEEGVRFTKEGKVDLLACCIPNSSEV